MRRKRVPVPVHVEETGEFTARNLGPLVLAHPMLEKMCVREIVEKHCGRDARLELSVGEVIHALAANRLCSPQPLMHVAGWAHGSGAELLLGAPAETLNDDRLARALDAVFAKRWNILADVALHVSEQFGIELYKLHYDPTSFHFTGEYEHQEVDPAILPEIAPMRIETGRHSTPGKDIKEAKVGVNLANDGKGPVPLFYHSADGSANDHTATAKNLQHLLKYLKPKRLLHIADRGTFSAKQAFALSRQKFHFIYSVPWSEELAQNYLAGNLPMREASFLSLAEQRKRQADKPDELWERYFVTEMRTSIEHERRKMRVRLIYVYSTADEKTCGRMRQRYTEKIRRQMEQLKRGVDSGRVKKIEDVHRRVIKAFGRKQAQKYFDYSVTCLSAQQRQSLPAPQRGHARPVLKFSYTYHPERAEQDAKSDGLYALMSNLPKTQYSTDAIFTAFKEQHHIETAHHQWKAPIRLRPLFLKKVKRIESLVFVQFLSLMCFYLLQRCYRNARGSGCRTTAETLLRRFALCQVSFQYDNGSIQIMAAGLIPRQIQTLQTLRLPSLKQQLRPYVTESFTDSTLDQQDDLEDIWGKENGAESDFSRGTREKSD